MVKPKKTKLVHAANQQRITSFFTSSSQSVKRPTQHNAGVSPNAKRDCTTTTTATTTTALEKENHPLTYKRDLSYDLGFSTSPKLTHRLHSQANGKVPSAGVMGGAKGEGRARESLRSIHEGKQRDQVNSNKGFHGFARNTLSSRIDKFAGNSAPRRPVNRSQEADDDDDDDVIVLSDDDDDVCERNEAGSVCDEEKEVLLIFGASQSVVGKKNNNTNSAGLGRGDAKGDDALADSSKHSHRTYTRRKLLHKAKDKERDYLPSPSTKDKAKNLLSLSKGKDKAKNLLSLSKVKERNLLSPSKAEDEETHSPSLSNAKDRNLLSPSNAKDKNSPSKAQNEDTSLPSPSKQTDTPKHTPSPHTTNNPHTHPNLKPSIGNKEEEEQEQEQQQQQEEQEQEEEEEEEEEATLSDYSEDLFSTPSRVKPNKGPVNLSLVEAPIYSHATKPGHDITSSDDELTPDLVESTLAFVLSGESYCVSPEGVSCCLTPEGREGVKSLEEEEEEEEDLDVTPDLDIATDITPDIKTDIAKDITDTTTDMQTDTTTDITDTTTDMQTDTTTDITDTDTKTDITDTDTKTDITDTDTKTDTTITNRDKKTDATPDMLKTSQDSTMSINNNDDDDDDDDTPELDSDMIGATQEFRVEGKVKDGEESEMGVPERSEMGVPEKSEMGAPERSEMGVPETTEYPKVTSDTAGPSNTRGAESASRDMLGRVPKEEKEEEEECHMSPSKAENKQVPGKPSQENDVKCLNISEMVQNLSPLKARSDSKQDQGVSLDGTLGTTEMGSAATKTPRKLSMDEENDCLGIMDMFGEMSPFKEKPTATQPVHGLLGNDLVVKKFLSDGQNKESFAAEGNYGRHLVVEAERDTCARTIHLHLLAPENVKRTCTLAGMWSDTVVRDGDIIHILLTDPVDGHYHIDNNQGVAVVHPDLLVSSTSVASGVFCRRRAVLAERHRATESSVIMMVGSLVHELFQEGVVEAMKGGPGHLTQDKLQALMGRLLSRPRVLQDLYRLGHTADSLRQDVAGFIPKVLAWCSHYLWPAKQGQGKGQAGGSYKWRGRITQVEEVEENLWCPRLGLKGKVDMVVRTEGCNGPAVLPLELKTGRASFSSEHCGQLALYAMMGSDRRPDPGAGLLLYLREAAMEAKVAPLKERRDLLCLRNDLAAHLAARPQPSQTPGQEPTLAPLPPPIAHERGCQQCPHKVTCAVHQVLRDEVPAEPHPMASLVPQHTAHLSSQHLHYFRHWCLLYQLEAAESLGGGGKLWCRNASQREEDGECLAWLVLGATPPLEVRPGWFLHSLARGRRHPGSAVPLASVGLQAGDQVIASSSKVLALACGSVQGFRDGAVLAELDRPLPAGIAQHYHLDLNRTTNFLRLPMQTLGRLLLPEPRAEALRRLVVDRAVPSFKKRVSSKVLACKPMLSHLNAAQKRAVVRAVAAEDYMLVQGFPGTGKSTMLATMVRVFMHLKRSVVITAYTNTALDSLLLKLHRLGIDFMRLGRADKVHPDLAGHTDEARTAGVTTVEELTQLYDSRPVVAATCLGLGHAIFSRRTFDVCIVDEAAQVLQVTALAPLFVCSTFVLVGDDKQLPPVVRSDCAVLHGITETLFERLYRPEVAVTLTEQYRMNGPIMALANHLTYNNQLTCGCPDLEKAALNLPHYQRLVEEGAVVPWLQRVVAPTLDGSVVLLDTAGGAVEEKVTGSSLANHREAQLVVRVVTTLLKAGLVASDIGIITPYRGQVKLVKTLLAEVKEQHTEEEMTAARIEVNTVDQYQGRDKMAIVCSFVRCGKTNDKPAGILTDRRRLNVALTRAKRKLILIGDQVTLTRYHSFSCLVSVLGPHQVYSLTPHTDGFQWQDQPEHMET